MFLAGHGDLIPVGGKFLVVNALVALPRVGDMVVVFIRWQADIVQLSKAFDAHRHAAAERDMPVGAEVVTADDHLEVLVNLEAAVGSLHGLLVI